MNLLVSFRSELLKIKRTSLIYLCIFGAALVPVMTLLLDNHSAEGLAELKKSPWSLYLNEGGRALSVIILPMYVILVCTLLPQLEFRNNTWKQVLTSPQSFGNIFAAKFLSVQLLIIGFILLYMLLMMASLMCVHFFRANLDLFNHRPDWVKLFTTIGTIYGTILAISAIQFWCGMRFRSFIVPIIIGFSMWFMSMMSAMEFHWVHASKIPYAFSILAPFPKYAAQVNTMLWSSVAYCSIVLVLAFLDFKMKKVKS